MKHEFEIHVGSSPSRYTGTPATRVYAVVGHPTRHSLSPRFQTAALRELGLDATYLAIDVEPADLERSVERMRAGAGRLGGINVTLPHKSAIIGLLDQVDEHAGLAGAVNTICFRSAGGGREPEPANAILHGFNTDIAGLLAALAEVGVSMAGVVVVVVGAGGAARAAVVAALQAGAAEVRVVNRTRTRAEEMLDSVAARWGKPGPVLSYTALDEAHDALRQARVLIHATSLGLRASDPSPIALSGAPPELFVLDTVYTAEQTPIVREARAHGLGAVNGLSLLVHQGAASLRLWTGLEPPLEVMRRSLGLGV